VITHIHADHLHGIDDLRPLGFKQEQKIPLYTDEVTCEFLRQKFPYIFKERSARPLGGGIPRLALRSFGPLTYPPEDEGWGLAENPRPGLAANDHEFCVVKIGADEFTFFSLPHGHLRTNGFYYEGFAYLTDCQRVRPSVLEFLKAQHLKLLIIECLQPAPHETHLGLAKTQEVITALGPEQVGLIHMAHAFSHEGLSKLMAAWRPHTFPVYDQQVLTWA
jgi:phosphoribosyl 1,2-cyclic phosphate phosphodiesterase